MHLTLNEQEPDIGASSNPPWGSRSSRPCAGRIASLNRCHTLIVSQCAYHMITRPSLGPDGATEAKASISWSLFGKFGECDTECCLQPFYVHLPALGRCSTRSKQGPLFLFYVI